MDITELILSQHHQQRQGFALLDEIASQETERLTAVWSRLVVLLETHAQAEELFFYPRLLATRTEAASADGIAEEVQDAVKDHNEIRDGITHAQPHPPGSQQWWAGVRETRQANSEHMAEEERDDLPDFRHRVDLATRHDIALEFLTYQAQHPTGITAEDKDPQTYLRRQDAADQERS